MWRVYRQLVVDGKAREANEFLSNNVLDSFAFQGKLKEIYRDACLLMAPRTYSQSDAALAEVFVRRYINPPDLKWIEFVKRPQYYASFDEAVRVYTMWAQQEAKNRRHHEWRHGQFMRCVSAVSFDGRAKDLCGLVSTLLPYAQPEAEVTREFEKASDQLRSILVADHWRFRMVAKFLLDGKMYRAWLDRDMRVPVFHRRLEDYLPCPGEFKKLNQKGIVFVGDLVQLRLPDLMRVLGPASTVSAKNILGALQCVKLTLSAPVTRELNQFIRQRTHLLEQEMRTGVSEEERMNTMLISRDPAANDNQVV